MYYVHYLASLCQRRHWPEPHYESFPASLPPSPSGTAAVLPGTQITGYTCIVRVNNREYQTDTIYDNECLARENAAMRAYLICRNFSVNDGMYPAGHDHGGVIQGIPVAIGTGRKRSRGEAGGAGQGGGREEKDKDGDDSTSTASSSDDFSMSLGSRVRSSEGSPDGSFGSFGRYGYGYKYGY